MFRIQIMNGHKTLRQCIVKVSVVGYSPLLHVYVYHYTTVYIYIYIYIMYRYTNVNA